MCCIFQYHTQMNNIYNFSRDQVTHDITAVTYISVKTTARVRYGLIPIYVSQWKPQHRVWEMGFHCPPESLMLSEGSWMKFMKIQTLIIVNLFQEIAVGVDRVTTWIIKMIVTTWVTKIIAVNTGRRGDGWRLLGHKIIFFTDPWLSWLPRGLSLINYDRK